MANPQLPRWYLGTMGYSYTDWKGVFYPANSSQPEHLSYYSRIFNSVEIDSSFYGTPRESALKRWAEATPPDFRLCLKAPREITHEAAVDRLPVFLDEFVGALFKLGDKLGVVLFQFPPSFHLGNLKTLETLLVNLPDKVRYAVEVRHQSWYTPKDGTGQPELADLLSRYRVCWAATDYPNMPRRIYVTANFFYIRWIGRHGSFTKHDRERLDRTPELSEWRETIRGRLQEHAGRVDTVYGYFSNDYAGFGPATAHRFRKIIGLE